MPQGDEAIDGVVEDFAFVGCSHGLNRHEMLRVCRFFVQGKTKMEVAFS